MSNHLDARYDELLKQIEKISDLKFKDKIPKDIYDLIGELHTYQVELELVNEEFQNSQEELINSRNNYFNFYNSLPICIFTLNKEKLITDVNLKSIELLNTKRENIINIAFVFFLTDNSQIIFSKYARKALKTKITQNCELEFIRPNKTYFHAYSEIKPIFDIEKKHYQFQIALIDIKEGKNSHKSLHKYQNLLHYIIEGTSDAIYTKDLKGRYTLFNSTAEIITGKKSEEVLGRDDTFLFSPNEAKKVMDCDHKIMDKGTRQTYEENVTTALGKKTYLSTKGPLVDDNNNVIGLFGIARDITERKKVEEALQTTSNRFYTILSSMRAAILLITEEGCVEFVNPAFCEYFSLLESPEDIVGLSASEIIEKIRNAYHNPDKAISRIDEIINHGQPVIGEEVPMQGGRTCLRNSIPLFVDGEPYGQLWVHVDITERKKAEDQINTMLEESQKLNEELLTTTEELQVANEELRNQGERLERMNRTLRALSDSDHAMMHAEDESKYLNEVCRIIIEDCGYTMVWIGFVEEDENKKVRPVAQYGFDEGYIEHLNITWADNERGRGPTGTAIRTGKPCSCDNMLTDPNFEPWREEAVKRGYASSIVLPLIANNKTLGAMSIYAREPDSFSDEEVKLLAELANDLAFGITNLRLRAENRRAEKDLRDSEQKLKTLFEILPVGVSIIDKNRDVVYENPALKRILDVSKKDLMEKTYEKRQYIQSDGTIMPYEEIPSVKAFKENKAVENVEIGIIKEDKSVIWTNVSAKPLSFSDWNILITTSDITERKNMEKELVESEERYRLILETANSGVFLLDAENKIKYLNQCTMRLLGYTAQEMLNESLTQFVDTKRQKNILKFMAQWRKGLNGLNEFNFIRKDGSSLWTLLAASPIIDVEGKYIGVICVITDINARKGVEKALMEREKISKAILYDMVGMINVLIKKDSEKKSSEKLDYLNNMHPNVKDEFENT